MRIFISIFFSGLLFFGGSFLRAQANSPTPYSVGLTDEIKLPRKTFQSESPAGYDLPALPAKPGLIPVFRARIYIKELAPGGFNEHAQVRLNGSVLGRRMQSGKERLLLRSATFQYSKAPYQVFAPDALQGDLLTTMFAPSASSADTITGDKMGATFLLNLSDFARGVDNNVLEVVGNLKATDSRKGMGAVEDASVGWLDAKLVTETATPPITRQMPVSHIESDGIILGAAKGGGVAIDFGGDRLCLETSDGMAGKNVLTVEDQPSSQNAQVVLSAPAKNTVVEDITWPNGLILHRSFEIGADYHIAWKETWTNSTDKATAVPFNDRLFLSGHLPSSIILAGNPDADALAGCASNPTIFIGDETTKKGFGWTAEDNWLRNLMQLSRDSLGGTVFSRNFMLEAGKSIAFEMSIQPQESSSYWDFINDLRQRWGVNSVRIDRAIFWGLVFPQAKGNGGWDGDPNTQSSSAVMDKGPLYAHLSPWLGVEPDVHEGIALDAKAKGSPLSEETIRTFYQYAHRATEMKAMEEKGDILRKQPGVEIMVGMHPSMEAAYLPFVADYPFHDEAILTPQGTPFQDGGYTKTWFRDTAAHGWAILYIAPTTGSRFSQELVRRITDALDAYKADAIYSDEFTFSFSGRGYSRYDYRKSDGYSAILNDQGAIVSKPTDMGLATIGNQLAMIQAVKQRGKHMLVNSAPATREVQNAGIWHFAEGGNGLWSGATTHLTTPLVLGNIGTPKSQEDVFKISLALLNTGCLHVLCSTNLFIRGPDNFIRRQFPITPQRLGPGFVMGPERIITSKSMNFTWPGKVGPVTIYRYDHNGNLLGTTPGTLTRENIFKAEVPDGGLLIVERPPSSRVD